MVLAALAMTGFVVWLRNEEKRDIKVGILSDIHLKLDYNATTGENWCGPWLEENNPNATYELALMGRLGCDATPELLSYMLDVFEQATAEEPVDVIFLNGDLGAHGVGQDSYEDLEMDNYEHLKENILTVR